MNKSMTIISRTKLLWQAITCAECLAYGVGIGFFLHILTFHGIAVMAGVISTISFLILLKPWKISSHRVAQLIDRKFDFAEYSTSLLLARPSELSVIAQIQQTKIVKKLGKRKLVWPPNNLLKAILFLAFMSLSGMGINYLLPESQSQTKPNNAASDLVNSIVDTTRVLHPAIESVEVAIHAPAYTNIKTIVTKSLDVKAVKRSWLSWSVVANESVQDVYLENSGKARTQLKKKDGKYIIGARLLEDGFYNFKIVGRDSTERTTDLYRLEVIEDEPPEIEVAGLKQHTTFDYNQVKPVNLTAGLSDDFGLTEAYIVATVSKGSGESVKFREQRLSFANKLETGSKQQRLKKTLDLKQMKMTPGDELYFYIEAFDNHKPNPQSTRTQTFFLSIRDTTDIEFSLAGSLGVDLMPEYFRSQRQIIIDTEKLIEERSKIPKHDFNYRSNELGFDQKALRLKYGQFMGVEDESGIAIEREDIEEEVEETDDPLAEYSHDHDGDNEHNLVPDEDHEEEDPLEKFTHDHDDPEEATLYTTSVRSMLKQAMTEMWDAELYLRLYQPKKSLPYQYKALNLIKKIKNHARIYVHRIGFDPPPIKEDKRLTGDIDEVEPEIKSETTAEDNTYQPLKDALSHIEVLLRDTTITLTATDHKVFEQAGLVLAPLAIKQPTKFLETLEQLKKLSAGEVSQSSLSSVLKKVSHSLKAAIPLDINDPIVSDHQEDELSSQYFINLTKAIDE